MKIKRLGVILSMCVCSVVLLTGCSFAGIKSGIAKTTNKIFGKTEEVTTADSTDTSAPKSGKTVDESVEKPAFVADLGGTIQLTMGSTYGLSVPATVSNGTLSYQWYTNNVNSNGGGTPIEGATEDHVFVDSSAPSHTFYYVVVTNEVDGKINKSTSMTEEVIIWDIGTWQADENGVVRYMLIDGSYPTNTWFYIDENVCYVKEDGARSTGLVQIGDDTYYFSDDGYLQRNCTGPDGQTIDENGKVVQAAAEQPAADQAAADQAAADQAAADQAAADQAAADQAADQSTQE